MPRSSGGSGGASQWVSICGTRSPHHGTSLEGGPSRAQQPDRRIFLRIAVAAGVHVQGKGMISTLPTRLVTTLLLGATGFASAQSPCVDPNQLLDVLSMQNGKPVMMFIDAFGAFFPEETYYDGRNLTRETNQPQLVLEKNGQEVDRWTVNADSMGGAFCRLHTVGRPSVHTYTESGDYALSVAIDQTKVTTLPFSVELKKSSDPFDPKTTVSVECDLMHWGQLRVIDAKGSSPRLEFGTRLRGGDFEVPKGGKVEAFIEQDGQKIYRAGSSSGAGLAKQGIWTKFSGSIQYLKEQGQGAVSYDDFAKRDGEYRVVMRVGDKIVRMYSFTIADGAVLAHERSAFSHAPATDYLLPRTIGGRDRNYFDNITWMESMDASAGAPTAKAVAGPSAAARAAWKPVVPAPKRPASIKLTNIAARVDAHIAAGDGVVAYGTGSNSGVAYIVAGEDTERTFAGGSESSSGVFFVCGKKLVLLNGNQVCVHDTVTGTSVDIPADVVTLPKRPSAFTKGRPIDADGMLVAVICDAGKVTDRRTIKVIDVSGSEPKVMALGFPAAEPRELATISVDAAGGQVVVGSDRKNGLFVAFVAENAPFRLIDLSAHDGYPSDCAPIVRGGLAAVFDTTGTRKLRLVDLASGSVTSVAPLAKAEQWFAFDGKRVALAGNTSFGGSYGVLVGTSAGATSPAGTGDSIKSGKNGYGQRIAMAESGIVFASGAGKGGIGTDEVLFATDGKTWHAVTVGGEQLKAVDITCGTHMLAFKTGKSRDAKVGYVLLGEGTNPTDITQ